jgi:hypothetical protein
MWGGQVGEKESVVEVGGRLVERGGKKKIAVSDSLSLSRFDDIIGTRRSNSLALVKVAGWQGVFTNVNDDVLQNRR